MRRAIPAFIAALLLSVALIGPATAAPEKRSAGTYVIACGQDSYAVQAPLGVPGWPVLGTSPILLMGGTYSITQDGVTVGPMTNAVPPGLEDKVRTCTIDGPVEVDPSVFHVHVDPAYMLFTG